MENRKLNARKIWLALAFLIAINAIMPALNAADESTWGSEEDAARVKYFFLQPGEEGAAQDTRHQWRGIAMLAIAVCIFANILVYMTGRALGMQKVERFAISEFYQVSASAIMIFLLILVAEEGFNFLAHESVGILPEGTTTKCAGEEKNVWEEGPFGIMRCKIQEKIIYLEKLYDQAYENNKRVEWKTATCIYFMSLPVYCGDWNIGWHATVEKSHYIAHKIAPIAINLHGQYIFATYLEQNMLAVFLPLGLILRIFPPFRGIGAMLIATSIGFYIVFPVSYILLDPSTIRPDPSQVVPYVDDANVGQCYRSFSGMITLLTKPPAQEQGAGGVQQLPDPDRIGKEIANLQVEAFFYPLAALAATMFFITTAAPILGGDSGMIMHFLAKVI
ncbi:MAG: hypothetical protein ABIH83_01095 [Candidatus Micrarchaeota archaeon]